jgi:hypothetical protein
VISLELARRLHESGVTWQPTSGDRFLVPDRDMDDDVFVVSDMVVEVHDLPVGTLLGFNGTTEWALDSVDIEDALWLPREDQLRALLGSTFRSLSVQDGAFRVDVVRPDGAPASHTAASAPDAYAFAVLDLIALAYV